MQTKLSELAPLMIGSTIIILLLTSLIVTYLFINQKRKLRYVHQLTTLKNTYDRELLQTKLEIQDETLKTVSRELHDNVGTIVSIALVHVKTIIPGIEEKQQQKMNEISGLLNEAIDTLRDISKSINSDNIARYGWLHCFNQEVERIRKTKMFTITTEVAGVEFLLESSSQLILFRLLQEALTNIIKHAEAREVNVKIMFSGEQLRILLADNGKGFDSNRSPEGSGLRNMQARAAMMPASLAIYSIPGTGTTIEFDYRKNDTKKESKYTAS